MFACIVDNKIVSRSEKAPTNHQRMRGPWVPEVEENARFDEITEQRTGPEIIIEPNVVRLVYRITPHPKALERYAADLIKRIDEKLSTEQDKIKALYSTAEVETWDQQRYEAQAYTLDPASATPLIDGMIAVSGEDKGEIVAGILAKASPYATASGANLGRMRYLKSIVEEAKNDLEELRRISNEELETGWY